MDRARRSASGDIVGGIAMAVMVDHHEFVGATENPSAARRRSRAACCGSSGRSPSRTGPSESVIAGSVAAEQRRQAALHRRGVRLAAEGHPQLVQAVLGLVAERSAIAGVGGQPGVDDVRVVVVVEFNHHVPVQSSVARTSLASDAIR